MTDERKWTPGPWQACHEGKCSCGFIWSLASDVQVASVHGPKDLGTDYFGRDVPPSEAIQQANAHLIVAAPDLFEALEGLLSFVDIAIDCWDDCPFPDAMRRRLAAANAARTKALGS